MTAPATIRVLSTLAVMGAMRDLIAAYQARTGARIEADFAPTVALLDTLRAGAAGAAGEVAILTAQGIDDLIAEGVLRPRSRTDVALSFVGIAVKAGAPHPDISSVDALRETLLAARCVAYSKIGASGIYFAGLLQRMGIADAVNARACVVPTGFTAERLVSNEADLAVQQISELKVVQGIEVIGPLPAAVQTSAMFSAGLIANAADPDGGASFVRFLTSAEAAPVLRDSGLQPAGQA